MRVRDAVFPNDDFGIDAGSVDVPEHVLDTAHRSARGRRPACDFDGHHVAGRSPRLPSSGDQDVHQQTPIEGGDEAETLNVAIVAPDDLLVGALENPNDPPFGAPSLLYALDAHHHTVALHRLVQMRT